MWDLVINFPIPAGARLLNAEAPTSFGVTFDGQEVSFKTSELAKDVKLEPLKVTIAATGTTAIKSELWAAWANVYKRSKLVVPDEDNLRTNLMIWPRQSGQIFFDPIGDAVFASYDLTGISFQQSEQGLGVTFHTAGELTADDKAVQYLLYIDRDCQTETGNLRWGRGLEVMLRYKHSEGEAKLYSWGEEKQLWRKQGSIESVHLVDSNQLSMVVAKQLLNLDDQFCWIGRARFKTDDYYPIPLSDWLIINDV